MFRIGRHALDHQLLPGDAERQGGAVLEQQLGAPGHAGRGGRKRRVTHGIRSEEHTSELQSQSNLVCRLLLEKKKKKTRQEASATSYAVIPCTLISPPRKT